MKRLLALLAALLLIATLTACRAREDPSSSEPEPEPVSEPEPEPLPISEPEPEPEASENIINTGEQNKEEALATARLFLEAAKAGDTATISQYIDYKQVLGLDASNAESEQYLLSILSRMDYTIDKARQEDSDGTVFAVEATIRNLNMESVMDAYVRACAELQFNNAFEEEPLEPDELEVEYARLLEETVATHKDDVLERYVFLRLLYHDDEWTIEPSLSLTDALLGGYHTARRQTGENAG